MRISLLSLLIVLAVAGQSQSFQSKLDTWVKDADLKSASIGFKAIKISSGEIIGELNPSQALVPASNLKLLTTAASLASFASNRKFETKIFYSGKIEDGILKGDLIIQGGGDPSLGSKYNGGQQKVFDYWIKAIKEIGINTIEGNVISDASSFPDYDIPRTWIWEDIGNYYGSGVSGLSFMDNTFEAYFTSPSEAGKATSIVSVVPEIPNFNIDNKVLSSNQNRDNAYLFGGPYNFNKKAEGSIPKGRNSFKVKGSFPDPALQLAYMFRNELISSGIAVKKRYSTQRELRLAGKEMKTPSNLIASFSGLELHQLVYYTNRNSVNLYAEHLHRLLGKEKYGMADVESGNKAVMGYLASQNLPLEGVNLMDGSGMSRFNTVTVDLMTALLIEMDQSKNVEYFKKSLAVSGESGTFKSFMTNSATKGKVKGKSGYMERVRSYSGYIQTQNGSIAFSIIVNNYSCTASQMKRKIELILSDLLQE